MDYSHRQRGWISGFLLLLAMMFLGLSWLIPVPMVQRIHLIVGVGVGVMAFCFQYLAVTDEGQRLSVRFGPIGLFGTRIEYAEITGVEVTRMRFVDGWGVKYRPGFGWTYSVSGFDAVVVQTAGRTVQIGTDDAEGLAAFLRGRMGSGSASG